MKLYRQLGQCCSPCYIVTQLFVLPKYWQSARLATVTNYCETEIDIFNVMDTASFSWQPIAVFVCMTWQLADDDVSSSMYVLSSSCWKIQWHMYSMGSCTSLVHKVLCYQEHMFLTLLLFQSYNMTWWKFLWSLMLACCKLSAELQKPMNMLVTSAGYRKLVLKFCEDHTHVTHLSKTLAL